MPPVGIPYVIFNGTIVVKDSKVLEGVYPGQPVPFAPVESRFEPISIKGWTSTYYGSDRFWRRPAGLAA